MSWVIKDAGLSDSAPRAGTPGEVRKVRLREIAQKLRAAQSDEEAADALEAAIELARD